ncbi:hypothetical protein CAPTEDRAFT_222815 [Capitella teleta]|uniref:Transmembrane protein 272-like n=1 Tax=Capitella teleta TaxID=283909 RepID=R7TRA0_CAPTE|nr:hypothetical protein CAPTEDRAFT_222815 [Capitella teleta]|eukprot:ELT94021.1 hypothetical protein CAPTEDRAFT_222815 [Capitella teleta]
MASNEAIPGDQQGAAGAPTNHYVNEVPPTEAPPPYNPSYGSSDAAPPAYSSNSGGDQPPSYDSLFGELRAAKSNSSSVLDYLKKFLIIVLSTLGCTICVGLVLALPVSMIVIGAIYFDDCPREKYISLYLIVGGSFGVLKNCSNLFQRFKNRENGNEDENAKSNPFDGTINCFLVAWFIAGNVWVYRIYSEIDLHDPSSQSYCHPVLYYFAFWMMNSVYILFACSCSFFCCLGMMAAFFRAKDPEITPSAC